MMVGIDFTTIKAFDANGTLMTLTRHVSPIQVQAEIEASRRKMKKGEIMWIEISRKGAKTQVVYAEEVG
jgi:hypothetical protein